MTDWFFGAGRSERKSDCIAPFISRHSLFHFNGSLIFSLGVLSNSLYSFLCHVCLVSCVVYGHCSWCSSASTCDVTLRPVLLISLYLSSSIFSFRLLRCCSLCVPCSSISPLCHTRRVAIPVARRPKYFVRIFSTCRAFRPRLLQPFVYFSSEMSPLTSPTWRHFTFAGCMFVVNVPVPLHVSCFVELQASQSNLHLHNCCQILIVGLIVYLELVPRFVKLQLGGVLARGFS